MSPSHAPDLPPPWNLLIPAGKKLLIWGVFFLTLYLLRDFLGLVFLTFVFGYVCEHGVQGLAHRLESRKLRTLLVFGTLIGLITLMAMFLAPELKRQAVSFVNDLPKHVHGIDDQLDKFRDDNPTVHDILGERRFKDVVTDLIGLPMEDHSSESPGTSTEHESTPIPSYGADRKQLESLFGTVISIFKNVAAVGMVFVLAVLFAFLIVMDLPRIAKGVSSLRDSKLSFVYDELSETVLTFGQVLGRFIEAQGMIAIINTAFTTIGMLLLGLNSLAFLAGIVFVCSFIPVAGVYLSTVPICLVALAQDDFSLVIWVIVMVTIVHALEAYVFNPMIFGAHLHMNPVLVLSVLVIGYQLFGIWGLLLGVPAVNYVFGHAIRKKDPEPAT